MGLDIRAASFSIQQLLPQRSVREISGAMCCGVGAWQADVAFQRQFDLTDKIGLRFRGEFFNIFNHPNFGPPNNNLPTPAAPNLLFGHSTQTLASSLGSGGAYGGFNPLYQIGGPRSIQLALKLQF
jgi:hypothetical protein